VAAPEAEPDGRIQHHLVYALTVHVRQPRHGVIGACTSLLHRNGSARGADIGAGLSHLPEPGHKDLLPSDEYVVKSVGIGRGSRPIPLGQGVPGGPWFENVAVAVEHSHLVMHHKNLSSSKRPAMSRQTTRRAPGATSHSQMSGELSERRRRVPRTPGRRFSYALAWPRVVWRLPFRTRRSSG
jgi:hypothetical protein